MAIRLPDLGGVQRATATYFFPPFPGKGLSSIAVYPKAFLLNIVLAPWSACAYLRKIQLLEIFRL